MKAKHSQQVLKENVTNMAKEEDTLKYNTTFEEENDQYITLALTRVPHWWILVQVTTPKTFICSTTQMKTPVQLLCRAMHARVL